MTPREELPPVVVGPNLDDPRAVKQLRKAVGRILPGGSPDVVIVLTLRHVKEAGAVSVSFTGFDFTQEHPPMDPEEVFGVMDGALNAMAEETPPPADMFTAN